MNTTNTDTISNLFDDSLERRAKRASERLNRAYATLTHVSNLLDFLREDSSEYDSALDLLDVVSQGVCSLREEWLALSTELDVKEREERVVKSGGFHPEHV